MQLSKIFPFNQFFPSHLQTFVFQNHKKCWFGQEDKIDYDKHGTSHDCTKGTGGPGVTMCTRSHIGVQLVPNCYSNQKNREATE